MDVSLYTTQVPSPTATDIFETSNVSVATTFYVSEACTCIGGNFFAPLTIGSGTFDLSLWHIDSADSGSGTGTRLAVKRFPSLTDGVWNSLLFDTGDFQALTPNVAYKFVMESTQGRYTAILNGYLSSGFSNDIISAPATNTSPTAVGNVYNGSYTGTVNGYPNQTFGGHEYLVGPTVRKNFDRKTASAFATFF